MRSDDQLEFGDLVVWHRQDGTRTVAIYCDCRYEGYDYDDVEEWPGDLDEMPESVQTWRNFFLCDGRVQTFVSRSIPLRGMILSRIRDAHG